MSLVLLALLVGVVSGDYASYTPATPTVDAEHSHSATISIDEDDVPDGTVMVLIQAMEMSDLTGNKWEDGYEYGYNSAVNTFYYPELNEASYHKFRIYYGNGSSYTEASAATQYSHSASSRYVFEKLERNWAMAKEFCLDSGLRLAVISTAKENEVVEEMMQDNNIETAWIGLYDEHYGDDNPNTTWSWVDGTKYKFSNFEKTAADSESTMSTSVVAINSIGEWETRSPSTKMSFICEKGVTEHAKASEARSSGMRETDLIQ